MDRLDAMHMFVRVVETGSFTKVAQEFATTQPTVTKQVAAMEARLKVRLLNRNTRGVSLTEAGALYYEKCKIIVSDGVFSMDGTIAQLDKICDLADRYGALVMIDECHASGFMGATGRGTHEHHKVMGRIDIITGTLGKALGGAMGGFTAARKEVIEMLRQKSRPYLFSNSLAPTIAGASLAVLRRLSESTELRDRLHANTAYFREHIAALGFTIKPGTHPVVPVMLFDAPLAQNFARRLYELGVLVTGFFYPVVPMGQARVRVQISAAHSREQLDAALAAFAQAGREFKLIPAIPA